MPRRLISSLNPPPSVHLVIFTTLTIIGHNPKMLTNKVVHNPKTLLASSLVKLYVTIASMTRYACFGRKITRPHVMMLFKTLNAIVDHQFIQEKNETYRTITAFTLYVTLQHANCLYILEYGCVNR